MAIIISALVLAATQVTPAAEADVSRIVVEGSGSVKTPPNVANVSFDVRGDGPTSDAAVAKLVAISSAVEKSLRSIDPNLNLRSDGVRIQPVRPKGCEERDYDDESAHLSTGDCAIRGYVAVQDFHLRTSDVTDAGTLVGLAGRSGAYEPKIESFGLADERAAKRAAIAQATADAQAKADGVAAGMGARRGPVISVVLDNARERAMDVVVTGYRARSPSAEHDEPIRVSVNPSPVETTAQLTVSYAINH